MSKHILCNNCGKEFDVDFDRDFVFCEFCGTKIELNAEPAETEETASVEAGEAKAETAETAEEQSAVQEEPAEAPKAEEPAQEEKPEFIPPVAEMTDRRPDVDPNAVTGAFAPAPVPTQSSDLSLAIRSYNCRDYDTANKCLEKLKVNEPDNFEVWFCWCKVLAAETPQDIKTAFDNYVKSAANCIACAPQGTDVRGNLTLEFNRFIKNMTDAIIAGRLYFVPYDMSVMSEPVPSFNYQPLAKVDEYYFMIMDGIKAFQDQVNPNYATNYFLEVWDTCFFCFAHEITQLMVNDLNNSKFFQWYKADLANRVTNDAIYRALCDLIYAYKNIFITLFNRLPYRDTKTTACNRITFLNKWLLKMKRTDQYGRTYLLVAQPADRAALDQEIRNYRIMLSQS